MSGSEAAKEIGGLAAVRKDCPALRLIVLPEATWDEFADIETWDDDTLHCSMVRIAYEKGVLDRITDPIDTYLVEEGEVPERVAKQYTQDLRERWVLEPDGARRHHQAQIFASRLCELQLALWLEQQRWTVTNLEAWRGKFDLEILDPDEQQHTVEVKYVGQEEAEFEAIRAAIRGEGRAQNLTPYDACDYLLLRAFEAARQLDGASGRTVVCIALSASAFSLLETELENRWIDWDMPVLLRRYQTPRLKATIEALDAKHGDLDAAIQEVLASVDDVWVVRFDHEFKLDWVSKRASGS